MSAAGSSQSMLGDYLRLFASSEIFICNYSALTTKPLRIRALNQIVFDSMPEGMDRFP